MAPFKFQHETQDLEILNYINNKISQGEDLNQVVEQILSVGVAVLQRVQTSRDVEFVKKETEKLTQTFQTTVVQLEKDISEKVESEISSLFNPDIEDSYTKKFGKFLNENLDTFRKDIKEDIKNTRELNDEKVSKIETGIKSAEENFNPDLETSYFGRIKNIIKDTHSKLDQQLDDQQIGSFAHRLKQDSEELFGEGSPIIKTITDIIAEQTKVLNEQLTELRDKMSEEEGAQKMVEKSSIKGRAFELQLLEQLEDLASSHGDIVEFTGEKAEDGTLNKKGDFIYTLNTGQKLIIEAKDREYGLKPSLKYLNEAMKSRSSTFSILIFKHAEQVPRQTGVFNFYEDDKVITSRDYLKFAIQWSRIYLNKAENKLAEGVNETLVLQRITDIQSRFKEISQVKNKMTQMQNSVNTNSESVRVILDRLKDDVFVYLNDIENEIITSEGQTDVFDISENNEEVESVTDSSAL